MAEPVSAQKAFDISPTALVKSTSSTLKGLLVIGLVVGLLVLIGLGVWIVVKPHFTKPQATTTIGNAGTVNQDCSKQVCDAIALWENANKKSQPWITLRLWKILTLGLGGT